MKNYRQLRPALFLSVALAFASCGGRQASISGTVSGLEAGDVIVKRLDINTYKVLDTVSTDASGHFRFRTPIEKGQPEFIYLFKGDRRIASLLLQRGDRVEVRTDTLGNYTVEGTGESIRLAEVEKDLSDFSSEFSSMLEKASSLEAGSKEAKDLLRSAGRFYADYYRSRVRYIMENSHSLTVIPVLYQTAPNGTPIFAQDTDAIHFNNIADSLETVYPDSRYVKSLRNEAKRRSDLLSLRVRIENAPQLGFPDIELPDLNSRKIKLSEVESKVVMVHFWTSSDAMQKMFNQDVLKPVYEDFHAKGFEIYQVALDADKAAWANTVKSQELPWINVCDGLGTASSAVSLYNIGRLPVSYFIADGQLVNEQVSDETSLRRLLRRLLK